MATPKHPRAKPKMSRGKAPARRRSTDASVSYRATHAPDVEQLRADIDAAIESGRQLREEIESRIASSPEMNLLT